MGDYAVVDESRAPLIHVRVVGEPTDIGFSEYLKDVESAFRKLDSFGLVFDSGDLGQLPSKYRGQLAVWLQSTRSEFEGRWVCSAFIIQSRVVRGVLTALFWVNAPYYKVQLFAESAQASKWVTAQLKEAALDVPA